MEATVRVTHKDIAARFGCDKSTVSLALRGHPRIPDATRRQICKLAERMGYRPDPALSMLARHRWAHHDAGNGATLAYIVDKSNPEAYGQQRNQFSWARERAHQRGYNLMEFDLSAYPSSEAASHVLYHRGIPGIILPHMPHGAEVRLSGLAWDRFTVVCCALGWSRVPFHVVAPDIFEGTRRTWQQVIKRGYVRVGAAMFRHHPVALDDFTRLGGSMVEQAELIPAEHRIPILQTDPLDRDAFLAWMKEHRPEAVIGFVNRVYTWLIEAGYRVPEDVAFACLNVWPGEPYSGMSVQHDQVPRSAVDFLISQMHENQSGRPKVQHCLLLEPDWVEGSTLPDRRAVGAAPALV
jgi:DNA-binding LacI/PurR family transcriptional regulator